MLQAPEEAPSPDVDAELQKQVEARRQARAEQCMAEINATLTRNRCQLVGQPVYTNDGRTGANVLIVADP